MSKARQLAQKPSQTTGRKNLIINGAMQVAQRGTTFSTLDAGTYTLDRFYYYKAGGSGVSAGEVTITQSSDAPSGFSNSLKVDVTTADTSVAANQDYRIRTVLEAQNLQHLDYGAAGAKAITISFWVKSNKTGTYTLNIYEADSARIIGAEYTINSANTWEKKEITFAGDTGGGINDDNGASMYIQWVLACGSDFTSGTFATSWQAYSGGDYFSSNQTNFFDSASNELYITGVQLEVGSIATEFEHRSYGEELQLCKRYYQKYIFADNIPVVNVVNWDGSNVYGTFPFDVEMRAVPTPDNSAASTFDVLQAGVVNNPTAITIQNESKHNAEWTAGGISDTQGQAAWVRGDGSSEVFISFDAEL